MKKKSFTFWWVILGAVLLFIFTVAVSAEELKTNETQPILVTATFFDSDLREALKEISLQTGVSIVIDDNVKGVITLDLKNVPLEKALRMMLIGGGFSARKIEDFYVVGLPDPKNPAFTGLCDTAIYYFKNIDAQSAKSLTPTAYEPFVKFDTAKDAAVIIAPPDLLQKILDDLRKMDGNREQIKIKALVTEVKNEVLKELGMNILDIDFTKPGAGWKQVGLSTADGSVSLKEQGDFGSLAATLKALVSEKKATIHADPVLIVTEGKSGDLFVGEKRTLILYSQGTNYTTSSTENVEAGTTLKVVPRLMGDQIELTITQKVSNFDDEMSDEITVHSREFNSVIRFLPGQTVMVAGLTEKKTRNNVKKTPILGDIPILGLLFKHKSDTAGDSEFLIFLTAEVVKNG